MAKENRGHPAFFLNIKVRDIFQSLCAFLTESRSFISSFVSSVVQQILTERCLCFLPVPFAAAGSPCIRELILCEVQTELRCRGKRSAGAGVVGGGSTENGILILIWKIKESFFEEVLSWVSLRKCYSVTTLCLSSSDCFFFISLAGSSFSSS